MLPRLFIILFAILITACEKPLLTELDPVTVAKIEPAAVEKPVVDEAAQVAALIDPVKLSTLKERGANPRIQKITAILLVAKSSGMNPEEIAKRAVRGIGWEGTLKGDLTVAAILRNLRIAEELGATTPEDIEAMKRGNSPTVRRGPCTGDILSVDHIIPVAAAPALSNCISNLELMPLPLNQRKGDSIGQRQHDLAKKLYTAGLLADPLKFP